MFGWGAAPLRPVPPGLRMLRAALPPRPRFTQRLPQTPPQIVVVVTAVTAMATATAVTATAAMVAVTATATVAAMM